jgi:branched-chain amino acid transport system substrate-binding protein
MEEQLRGSMTDRKGQPWWLRLPILAIAVIAATLAITACGDDDDDPDTADAQAAFCQDLDALETAVADLSGLSGESTVDDISAARDDVTDAMDDVRSSAEDVADAKIDTLETAYDDLSSAVDDLDGDATASDALATLEPQLTAVDAAWDEAYTSADCLNAGGEATPGATSEATAGATAPSGTGEIITIPAGEAIKIGISSTLTTDNAELGIPVRDAGLMAVADYGEIQGFAIEPVQADDVCSGPGSETAAQQLIAEAVVAVMGPLCSGGAVAAMDDYAAEGILTISGSASAAIVTDPGAETFARTAWNDATQGEEMAKFVYNDLSLTQAVLVDDQSTYGKGLMDVFEESFTGLGGTIVGRQAVTVGEQDFSSVVTSIGTDPEIVVFGGYIAEGAALVRQLRDAGFEGVFMGADGVADQDFIDQAGGAAENAYVSRGPQSEVNNKEAILAQYHEQFGANAGEQFVDFGYDAMTVILTAIEQVAVVNADGDLEIDRAALVEAAMTITLEGGATGTIEFLENGDRDISAGAVNQIDQVQNNALVNIR